MAVAPLQPVYDWVDPGEPLEVLSGDGRNNEDLGPVRVWAPMKRDVELRWRATEPGHFALGSSTLFMRHGSYGNVEIPVEVSHSEGRGRVSATELGRSDPISRVVIHWLNLPLILPGAGLEHGGLSWVGRWTVDAGPWRLTIDSRSDLSEAMRSMSADDEQFAMTHVGELRAVDGSQFDAATACQVLYGWQLAMSFALGRWVAPALPVGFDERGARVWEQWAPWRCDEMRGYQAWWDTHTGDDLASFVSNYLVAFLKPDEHPIVRHVVHHVIAANHAGTTGEAKIMLAQAGLEYLAWVNLVLSGRMSKRKYKDLHASGALRSLMTDALIPVDVPPGLDAVTELAQREGLDGPGAVAWVRNRLVHPKDPDEPYRIADLVWQTSQLCLEYAELLLLHRVGYLGRFQRRYPPHRWAHDNEPVPWAPSVTRAD